MDIKDFLGIETEFNINDNYFEDQEYKITALQAINEVKIQKCELFDLDIRGIKLYENYEKSMINIIQDYYRIKNCSLEHPIILAPNGNILDGVHRVCKAIIEGKMKIKAYRLKNLYGYEKNE